VRKKFSRRGKSIEGKRNGRWELETRNRRGGKGGKGGRGGQSICSGSCYVSRRMKW